MEMQGVPAAEARNSVIQTLYTTIDYAKRERKISVLHPRKRPLAIGKRYIAILNSINLND
jgi:hypothetical protein